MRRHGGTLRIAVIHARGAPTDRAAPWQAQTWDRDRLVGVGRHHRLILQAGPDLGSNDYLALASSDRL